MAFLSTTHRNVACKTHRVSLLDLLSLYRQRRALARLDDAALTDLGINRNEAKTEANRPIWDVPCHWVK